MTRAGNETALLDRHTPLAMALALAASVFAAELVVMLLLGQRPISSPRAEALADAALLTVLLVPPLYLLLYRPLARRAAARLSESEERFRFLVENSADVLAVLDTEGRVAYVSPPVERILGYPPADFVGRAAMDLVHPDDAAALAETLGQVAQSPGETSRLEARVRHWDGSWRTMEARVHALASGDRSPGILVDAHDVTARAEAEQTLKESEERLERAVWGAELGLWDWDVASGVVIRNEHWAQTLGYDPGEISDSLDAWRALIHPEDLRPVDAALGETIQGVRSAYREEYRLRAKSGEWRWVLDCGKVVARDASGSALRVAGTHLDVSDRRRAEARLRESEGRFRSLVENTSDWIWEVDENAVYTYASPRVKQLLGREPEEVVGKTPFDLMRPEEAKRVAAVFGPIAEARESFAGLENTNLHKDGHGVLVETSGVPILDAEGGYKGYRGIDRDIGARKRAEEALTQAHRLQSLGVLAGGVAHDFNTLLGVVLGHAGLALQKLAEGEPARRHVEQAIVASQRAAELTSKMLAYSGRSRFEVDSVDINGLVRDSRSSLAAGFPERVPLELQLAESVPAIEADAAQLGLALR